MTISKEYPCALENYTAGRKGKIEYIVIHYTGGTGSALANVRYYSGSPDRKASAHYFVGHKSEGAAIYQSVAPKNTAWHCGAKTYKHPSCRNSNSIGIEMCCHNSNGELSAASEGWYFDGETENQAAALTRELMKVYKIPADHVVRHFDVTGKVCPAPFVKNGGAWTSFIQKISEKGDDDMAAIISGIARAGGMSENDAITALKVIAKFANRTEEAWEKAGVQFLVDQGLIVTARDGREPVEFGELGVILKRLKDSVKLPADL